MQIQTGKESLFPSKLQSLDGRNTVNEESEMDSLDRELLDNRSDDSPLKKTRNLSDNLVGPPEKDPNRPAPKPIISLVRASHENALGKGRKLDN